MDLKEGATKHDDTTKEKDKNKKSLDPKKNTEVPNKVMTEILKELGLAREERARMEERINGIKSTINNMKSEVETLKPLVAQVGAWQQDVIERRQE